MQGALGPGSAPGIDGHALLPHGIEADDDLICALSLSMFDSPAHVALLSYWASLVPHGRFVVPESVVAGGLRLGTLETELGAPSDICEIEGRRWGIFRGRPWRGSNTVIDWWHDRGVEVATAQHELRPVDLRAESLETNWPVTFMPTGKDVIRSVDRLSPRELGAAWSYQVWAVLAKIAVLRWILREFEVEGPVDHVDLGPGPGLVGAELVLDPTAAVRCSMGLELRAIGPWSGCRLAGATISSLGDLWRFRLGTASTWSGSPRLGLFTALGSLFLLPRTDSAAILEHAWDSLLPGGLLVVHENIRHERFAADQAMMFDRVELEDLLGRFGPVQHVAATAYRRLQPDQVGEKTIFRVVVKRS